MALLWSTAVELVDLINTDASLSEFEKSLRSCQNPNETVGVMKLTVLHHAVFMNRADCVESLLQHHVDANIQDYCGYTPIHLAAKGGLVEILAKLVEPGRQADTNKQDSLGLTPLFHAMHEGNHACAEVLLQNGANPNFCHKHIGCDLHRIPLDAPKCLETLLRYGADPETRTPKGLTALHAAIEAGSLPFVKILVELGCDVNAWTDPRAPGKQRRNGLQMAIIGNEIDIVRCLLAHDADPNSRDQQGNTPLHHASAHRDADMIRLLLEQGASNIHAKNDQQYEPLHRACSAGRDPAILTLLLKSGADTNALNSSKDTPLHCLLLHYVYLAELEEEEEESTLDHDCWQRVLPFINNGGRFTITTDREDDRSVLKMLPLMTALPQTIHLLETGADRIHIHDTGDLLFILAPEPLKSQLLAASRNPASLKRLVRRVIRSLVSYKQIEDAMRELPLPSLLQNYLLFLWG